MKRQSQTYSTEDNMNLKQDIISVNIPGFSIYSMKLKVLFKYSVSLNPMVSLKNMVSLKDTVSLNMEVLLKSSVSFDGMGHRMHFWRRFPIKSWRPTRAKTARAKTVRTMTSTIFFTDWIKAATMVFKPDEIQIICQKQDRKPPHLYCIAHKIQGSFTCLGPIIIKINWSPASKRW